MTLRQRLSCLLGWHCGSFELEYGALRCARCREPVGVIEVDHTPTYGDRSLPELGKRRRA